MNGLNVLFKKSLIIACCICLSFGCVIRQNKIEVQAAPVMTKCQTDPLSRACLAEVITTIVTVSSIQFYKVSGDIYTNALDLIDDVGYKIYDYAISKLGSDFWTFAQMTINTGGQALDMTYDTFMQIFNVAGDYFQSLQMDMIPQVDEDGIEFYEWEMGTDGNLYYDKDGLRLTRISSTCASEGNLACSTSGIFKIEMLPSFGNMYGGTVTVPAVTPAPSYYNNTWVNFDDGARYLFRGMNNKLPYDTTVTYSVQIATDSAIGMRSLQGVKVTSDTLILVPHFSGTNVHEYGLGSSTTLLKLSNNNFVKYSATSDQIVTYDDYKRYSPMKEIDYKGNMKDWDVIDAEFTTRYPPTDDGNFTIPLAFMAMLYEMYDQMKNNEGMMWDANYGQPTPTPTVSPTIKPTIDPTTPPQPTVTPGDVTNESLGDMIGNLTDSIGNFFEDIKDFFSDLFIPKIDDISNTFEDLKNTVDNKFPFMNDISNIFTGIFNQFINFSCTDACIVITEISIKGEPLIPRIEYNLNEFKTTFKSLFDVYYIIMSFVLALGTFMVIRNRFMHMLEKGWK
ncbi:hypothetical protein [Anaerorhabdus sp.]|uniref:hypothetical protein n=1 Tax=Anaerorhabdus sp. TaxID=1872524 RepID=UPI002FCC3445